MKTLAYFAFLMFWSVMAVPMGGSIYLLLGVTFHIPYIGRVFGFLLHDTTRITVLVKLVSWLFSASGLIVGYLLCQQWLGPPDSAYQWWAVVLVTAGTVSHLAWRIITFELFDVVYITQAVSKFVAPSVKKRLRYAEAKDVAMLLRQNFAELTFVPILRFLVAFGLLLFALANLRFIRTKSGAVPTLQECIETSLSIVSLGSTESVVFEGLPWLALRVSIGIVLLVWAVAFVSFAIESLPSQADARSALDLAEPSPGLQPSASKADHSQVAAEHPGR